MDRHKCLWVVGSGISSGICWCPQCGVSVAYEQKQCLVCGYGEDVTDINVGCTGYDDHDCSGLLDD